LIELAAEANSTRTTLAVESDAVLGLLRKPARGTPPTVLLRSQGNRLTLAPRKKASLMRLALMMVEARGVEPLSEDNATCASTGVVTDLMSP